MNSRNLFFCACLFLGFGGGFLASAQAQHKGISFQGVIKLPNGEYPTRSGVTVNARILSVNDCILREEQFTGVNLSNGYLNLAIGTGTVGGYDPGFSLKEVMDNSKAITSGPTKPAGLVCLNSDGSVSDSVTGYTPNPANNGRKFRLSLYVDAIPIVADFNMRSMAYALNSESLDGKSKDEFIQTSATLTQSRLEDFITKITSVGGGSVKWNGSSFVSFDPTDGTNLTSVPDTAITSLAYSKLTAVPETLSQMAALVCDDGKIIKKISGMWACADESSSGFTGVLAGDVSGAQNATSVDKIKGVPVSAAPTSNGQVLRYEGGSFVPGYIAMQDLRSQVTGTQMLPANCMAKQTLTFNSATDSLACVDIAITKSQISDLDSFWSTATGGISYSGGNVGIGVLNPSAKVHIQDTNVTGGNVLLDAYASSGYPNPAIVMRSSRGPSTAPTAIQLDDGLFTVGGRGYNGSGFTPTSKASVKAAAAEDWTASANGAYLALSTTTTGTMAAQERVRISDSGKVGIGTSNPGYLLSLVDTTSNDSKFHISAAGDTGLYMSATSSGGGTLSQGAASTGSSWVAKSTASSVISFGSTGGLSFSTNSGLTAGGAFTPTERMRIAANGNVGIGTTNPERALTIVGTGGVDDDVLLYLKANSDTGAGLFGSARSRGTAGAELPVLNGDLILDISGRGYNGSDYVITSAIVAKAESDFNVAESGNLIFQTKEGGVARSEKMRITGAGKVGIGISNPTRKFEVEGAARVGSASVTGEILTLGSARSWLFQSSGSGESTTLDLRPTVVGKSFRIRDSGDSFDLAKFYAGSLPSNSRVSFLPAGGNVGVGTENPAVAFTVDASGGTVTAPYGAGADKLAVIGTGNTVIQVTAPNTATSNLYFSDPESRDVGGISYSHATDILQFRVNNAYRMTIDSAGNVGIGGAPSQLLTVHGSAIATAWNLSSDVRLKENVKDIENPLSKVLQLRGVEFDWRKDVRQPASHEQSHDIGVIAQEVEKVFPEAVTTGKDGFKSVAYSKLISPVIEAIRALYSRLTAVENQQQIQSQNLTALMERLSALEARAAKAEQENEKLKSDSAY